MKYLISFLIAFSFHFQVFANGECQNITLEHIDIDSEITKLTFVHQDGEQKHQYVIMDGDKALSLLTIVSVFLTEGRPLDDSSQDLLHALAGEVIDFYNEFMKEPENQGDPALESVIGRRIDTISKLLEDNLSPDTLNVFYNEYTRQLSYPYFRHSYKTYYHTNYNQNTDRYGSLQFLEQTLSPEEEAKDDFDNTIGHHIMNNCLTQEGDLGYLHSTLF